VDDRRVPDHKAVLLDPRLDQGDAMANQLLIVADARSHFIEDES
jgi:hypothetical protein